MQGRNKIFLSYASADREWLERLRMHLKPLERQSKIEVWADASVAGGDDWREAIERRLAECNAAVLLVSPEYLASDYIADRELPHLLAKARTGLPPMPIT